MSNINTAFGLRPIGIGGGAYNTSGTTEYRIAANYATPIYQGAMVIAASTGTIVRGSATGTTQTPVGVFGGCTYVDAVTKKPRWSAYWPGVAPLSGSVVRAHVYDSPQQLFLVAANALFADAAALQAAVFANANLAANDTGSASSGISGATLNVGTLATTADHILRVVGISEDAGNEDITAAGIGLIVRLNRHFNAGVGAAQPNYS